MSSIAPTPAFFPPFPAAPNCPLIPPCRELVDGPEAVLLDIRRWPQHLCIATLRWSTQQMTFLGSSLAHPWPRLWPLPIGDDALLYEREFWRYRGTPLPEIPHWFSAPFGDPAWAALAVCVIVDGGVLDLFSTLSIGREYESALYVEPVFSRGPLLFRLRGQPYAARQRSPALRLVRQAERWWSTVPLPLGESGRMQEQLDFPYWHDLRRAGARPPGNRTFETREEFLAVISAIVVALKQNHTRRPTEDAVVAYLTRHSSVSDPSGIVPRYRTA